MVTLRLRGSPGTTRTVAPSASTRRGVVGGVGAAGVGPAQHVGPEGLGRLHRHQVGPVDGPSHGGPSAGRRSMRLTVSATGHGADRAAGRAGGQRRRPRPEQAGGASGRAASWTTTTSAPTRARRPVRRRTDAARRGAARRPPRRPRRSVGGRRHARAGTTSTTPSATGRRPSTDQSTTGRPAELGELLGRPRSGSRARPATTTAHTVPRRPPPASRVRAAPRRGASRPSPRPRRGRRSARTPGSGGPG